MTASAAGEVTVYDRLVWPDGALDALLASGERRRELIAYFGLEEYLALVPLATAAMTTRADPRRVVYLVPGIMGSQLGVPRPAPLPADLLWIDPVDFQRGGLLRLALDAETPDESIQPCGPIVFSYLRLRLALRAAGCTVRCFDYDWRRGVLELGRRLARRIDADGAAGCALVGHSMGGLVARAALTAAPDRIGRIVTLGTPHAGSYASLQALRGVYGTVRRLAQLDPTHTAEALATRVFSGFQSLYDMLPRGGAPDFLDPLAWPRGGPQPREVELDRARSLALAEAPAQVSCIVGTGEPTVTGVTVRGSHLRFEVTRDGDGTVPRDSAALANHVCRYVPLPHSELPRDARVARAVLQLLETGATAELPTSCGPAPPLSVEVDEESLRAQFNEKLDWQAMSPEERRAWLDELNAPMRVPPP